MALEDTSTDELSTGCGRAGVSAAMVVVALRYPVLIYRMCFGGADGVWYLVFEFVEIKSELLLDCIARLNLVM